MILQRFDIDPIFTRFADDIRVSFKMDDTVGFSGSRNQIGIFFAVTGALILRYCPYLLPLSFMCLIWSTTTTAFGGFIVSIFFYAIAKLNMIGILTRKNIKVITLGLMLAAFFCGFLFFRTDELNSVKYQERMDLWKNSLSSLAYGELFMYEDINKGLMAHSQSSVGMRVLSFNPLFGIGLGTFTRYSIFNQNFYITSAHRYEHAHNDLVEVFIEMGYWGGMVVVFIMIDIVQKFIKARKTDILLLSFSGLLAQFICSLGVYTVHTAVAGMLLILNLGIFYGEVKDGEREIVENTKSA